MPAVCCLCWSSQEKPTTLAQTCPNKYAVARYKGAVFGLSRSCGPQLGVTVLLCAVPLCWLWEGKWCRPPISSPNRESHTPCYLAGLYRVVRSVTTHCTTALLHFTFGAQLGFKTSHVKGFALCRPSPLPPPQEQSFSVLCLMSCVPEKQSHTYKMCEIYGVAPWKSPTGLSNVCTPLPSVYERPFANTCGVFCPCRGNIPSAKCTLGRGMFSPSLNEEIPTPLYALWCQRPPSPQSIWHSSFWRKSHTSPLPKPQNSSSACYFLKIWHSVPLTP